MQLKSLKGCRLAIGSYPHFIYDATGGGGQGELIETNKNTKFVQFNPQQFKIPPLTWKTTKFLSFPLPPGLKIDMSMEQLKGTINQEEGEINLNFKARFSLHIFSLIRFPDLIVKSLLNTGKVKTKFHNSEGIKIKKNGNVKLVGIANIEKTQNYFLDKLLFLPADAIAELMCEVIYEDRINKENSIS